MKISLYTLALVVLLASCSTQKVAYKFDYHDYNAGRKVKEVREEVASNPGPVAVEASELTAMVTPAELPTETSVAPVLTTAKPYEEMTRREQREVRREVKKEIKQLIKNEKDGVTAVEATKGLDKDLKFAAIFGAVGIIGLILSGPVFYIIGGIALIIGAVFFVRWLLRQ